MGCTLEWLGGGGGGGMLLFTLFLLMPVLLTCDWSGSGSLKEEITLGGSLDCFGLILVGTSYCTLFDLFAFSCLLFIIGKFITLTF